MDERNCDSEGRVKGEERMASHGARLESKPTRVFFAGTLIAIVIVFASAALQGRGETIPSSSSLAESPSTTSITMVPGGAIGNLIGYYYPENVTVVIGVNNTMTWTNQDMLVHSVAFDNGRAYSGDIEPGKSWTYTFTAPGVYGYHCYLHPWMQGTVTVIAGSS
jgi:plastocyanin